LRQQRDGDTATADLVGGDHLLSDANRLTFLDDRTRTRRDHEKYLTLIDAIALLHQHQRSVKTLASPCGTKTLRYVEVEVADIALANELAHEVLGRTLDELPPQTRKLLSLLVSLVERECAAQSARRVDYRFSRRQVREATKWGDTQLKIHLARLVELEYLLVHRGGRGQSFEYELLYDGAAAGHAAHVSGLIDVEALSIYDAERSALSDPRPDLSRGAVGALSVGSRVPESALPLDENRPLRSMSLNGAANAHLRPRDSAAAVPATL